MMATPFVTGTRKLTVDAKRFGAVSLLFIGGLLVPVAYADTWVEVTGSDTLRELVSGATATIEVDEDIRAVGKYFEDGTAKIEAWGETFDRTWEVQGDDQVCYSSLTEISCFSFERSQEQPNRYRVNNVKTRQFTYFEVEGDGDTVASAPASGAQEGGLAGPSASEIAAELSNPNSTLGTMNFNIDYLVYQGDLPGASDQSNQPCHTPYRRRRTFSFGPPFPLLFGRIFPQASVVTTQQNLNWAISVLTPPSVKVFREGISSSVAWPAHYRRRLTMISASTSGCWGRNWVMRRWQNGVLPAC
jgi:hypothetical protein